MKTRNEVSSSSSDRRQRAVLRTSSAVGVALLLMAVATVVPTRQSPDAAIGSDTFGLEFGVPARSPAAESHEANAASTSAETAVGTAIAGIDEFAFPAGFELEPLSY